jgi:CxxC motif-containing protein
MLCIRCPKGCELEFKQDKTDIKVKGNECRIGIEYAIEEIKNPRRIVSSTITIYNAKYPRLPIRTKETVPKDKIEKIIQNLKGRVIKAPVKNGQIIIKNIAQTGVDIISERDMECVKS